MRPARGTATVVGGSMWPPLRPGARVTARPPSGAARPHAALVTALAAGDVEGVRRALRGRPDGEKVADLAALHQVDALCWWMWRNVVAGASDVPPVDLPPSLCERLRIAYLHHSIRNEVLVNDLALLQETLADRGVEALYFKGPWMAFRAYPDPGTRSVGDVDLCVREEHYGGAVAALEAGGWRPRGALPRTSGEALTQSHYRRQLRFSAPGRRPVELHFRLVNMGPPGEEEPWLWESARELRVGSCSLRVPGPEAMLLHLLLHANQHGFRSLRLLHDVRWALPGRDGRDLDAVKFHRLAAQFRCRAACYHALGLAGELAGAEVDGAILEPLRPPAARRRFFAVMWRLDAVRRLEASPRRTELEGPFFYLLEMGRLRHKALFVARVITAVRESKTPLRREVGKSSELPERPRLRAGLVFRQLEKESVAYSPVTDRTALLNPSAAATLKLCDGRRTAGEIAAEVAALFAAEKREILPSVEAALNDFMARGFLETKRCGGWS